MQRHGVRGACATRESQTVAGMQGGIADPATVGVIWVPTGAVDFGFVWATPVDDVASHWLVGALGRRWWTDAASDGWFGALGAALVDDAASDGWFGALGAALVDDAASDVGLVRWGQHWWTMSHPMVGLVRWGQRWWTMRHPIGGLCAWTAPVDDAASDGWLVPWTTLVDHASEDRRCPHRAKIRRVGAAERGTRRFPDFQDHYSIRKCWGGWQVRHGR